MKKKNLLLTFLLAALIFGGVMGQTVTIGSGTTTNQNVPIASSQTYSLSEQIYTEAEIHAAGGYSGNIVSIAFFNSAWSNKTRNFNIYLVHTDKSSFSSTTNWISGVTSSDLVYSGNVTLTSRSWTTITFDSKFNWNGTSNIALIIDSNSGDSALGSYVFSGSSQSLYINGTTDIDPTNTSATGTLLDVKNIIKLTFEPLSSCSKPTELACLCFTSNAATFDWTENGTADTWQVVYSTNPDFAPNSATPITVTTKPYTLRGLTTGTTYYAYVRSYCDEDNQSAWSNKCEFTPSTNIALTANDGSSTNSSVPVYYSTISDSSDPKSQYIIPSSNLNAMKGGEIQKITFYNNNASLDYGDAEFDVYLGEVNYTTIESFCDWSNLSKVYSGGITVNSDKEMELSFSTAYTYQGGNLLIGFYRTKKGTNPSFNLWYGITTNYNSSIRGTTSSSFEQFIPKTTFTYTPAIKFATAGNWNVTDNWYGNIPSSTDNVLITAAVTIPNGYTATANDITIDGGSLTIEDGGRLVFYNTGVQATVKKEITGVGNENWNASSGADGWYFIASPVNGAAFPTGSVATQDIYQLDWAANKWLNLQITDHSSLLTAGFQRGTGYLYASKGGNTISVAGEIQPLSGSDNATVTLATTGWNLIGNPLTCKVTVDKAFSELNNASSVTNQDAGAAINPFQGIAVYGTAGDVVTFTKAASQNAVAPSNNALQMTLSQTVASRGTISSEVVDNAIVKFNGNSSLPKFSMLEGKAKLYIPQNGEEYAIVSTNAEGEMPVNFKANENGQYTLTVNAEDVEMNYLHLIDNMTGADIDLMANPSYTFDANATDYASRFRIVFSGNGVEENLNESDNFAFIGSDGQLVVSGTGTIQILDMMGRVISTKSTEENISTNGMASGVYVLRLIGNETKTQKIVVR